MNSAENIYHQPPDYYDATLSPDYIERFYLPVKDLVQSRLESGARAVLDLCCGTGVIAELLLDLPGMHYTGVDINSEFLARARERTAEGQDFVFIESDVMSFTSNERFDVILLINAYHHVPDSGKSQLLQKVRNLLAPDGVIILYEMLIPRFDNINEFAAANEIFYRKRIEWIKQNEELSPKKLEGWLNICRLSAKAEDEYKIYYDYLIEDLASNDLSVQKELKTWPDRDLFEGRSVGDYIFVVGHRPAA